ncbi:MAG TPA: methyltransferase domain-containing protein [Blastococcus sp.]|jgi:SAM-dependent methyltransferase|nr:methyltransferase domain-containing protein [Blastococcus sp.]
MEPPGDGLRDPVTPSAADGYLLANQQTGAGRRLAALAAVFDASTFRHLTDLGLGPGWRVWEVGAGGRSVPDWLVRQVGPDGEVLATDLDTTWLSAAAPPGLTVLRHDVALAPPPDGPFDLIHARLVLVHVPQRERALEAMVSVLRPGGLLVLEDADPALQPLVCPEDDGPAQQLANRLKRAFRELMAQRGADLAFGRTLPRRLRAAGLVEVAADAWFPLTGPACTELERATIEQIRGGLGTAGLAMPEEIDAHLANVANGVVLDLATSPMVTAWGRKP